MSFGAAMPSIAVVGACLFWAIDNNLTRKVALLDSSFIAMNKGLVAGAVNTVIALTLGATLPSTPTVIAAAAVGLLSYGLSLMLFVVALRHLGTARTGAYFSTAPFAGAVIAVVGLGEPITIELLIAGALMAAGVWLHLTETHEHTHEHVALEHEHIHTPIFPTRIISITMQNKSCTARGKVVRSIHGAMPYTFAFSDKLGINTIAAATSALPSAVRPARNFAMPRPYRPHAFFGACASAAS
jgi:EamA-like transporter family